MGTVGQGWCAYACPFLWEKTLVLLQQKIFKYIFKDTVFSSLNKQKKSLKMPSTSLGYILGNRMVQIHSNITQCFFNDTDFLRVGYTYM